MRNCLLMILLFSALAVTAEEPIVQAPERSPRHLISMVPQYAFMGGFRIDYDIALNQKNWLQFAPAIYAVSNGRLFNDYERMEGFSLHAYHRYFPAGRQGASPVYVSCGLVYQNFSVWHKERVGNDRIMRTTRIQRAGFDLLMGVSSSNNRTLIIDLYGGMGFRHALYATDASTLRRFDDGFFDIGYSGIGFIMGLRFGVFIK